MATPRIVGNGEELPTHHIVFAVDGNVGHLALRPFRNRKQRLVLTVNILAEFELAAVVYEGRLLGHVNRYEGRKRDIDFVAAKHRAYAVLRVTSARPHKRQ